MCSFIVYRLLFDYHIKLLSQSCEVEYIVVLSLSAFRVKSPCASILPVCLTDKVQHGVGLGQGPPGRREARTPDIDQRGRQLLWSPAAHPLAVWGYCQVWFY